MAEQTSKYQEFLERKKELAARPDRRVVPARTKDTAAILILATSADFALNKIRRNIGISVDFDEGQELIEKYKNAVLDYARAVKDICDKAEVDFRAPQWIREKLGLTTTDGVL